MGVQGTLFVQPTGISPPQLYQSLKNLIDTLNRQSSAGGTLPPSVQDAINDVQTQIDGIVANGDLTPQQAFELSLVTRADEIFGSYTQIRDRQQTQMEQNADAIMQAAIQAAEANTGVQTTVKVMNAADQALAQQITTVNASLGVTNGNVIALAQAVADGNQALAAQINTVSSSVAGNTNSITALASSVNGIAGRYGVQINNNNEVIGEFRLDGTPIGSTFNVNVDAFYVGKAGTSGGSSKPVFAIQTVNGASQIAIRGDLIADGTISAAKIAAGSVTADKISVANLGAVSANIGTITNGYMQDPTNTFFLDLTNGKMGRTDGRMLIDFKNGTEYIGT